MDAQARIPASVLPFLIRLVLESPRIGYVGLIFHLSRRSSLEFVSPMANVELPAEMHCRSCEQRIRRAVAALDGVSSVDADLKRQRVIVKFDAGRVEESEVRATVAGASPHEIDC